MKSAYARPYKIGYRIGDHVYTASYRTAHAARMFRGLLLSKFAETSEILWTEGFLNSAGAREFWYLFTLDGQTRRVLFGSQADLEAFGRGLASIDLYREAA